MKKITFIYIVLGAIVLSISSCKEIDQPIVLDPSQLALFDTTYISSSAISPSEKNVLIEEFSGVRCPNCPAGNTITKQIHNEYNGRVNVVTVHSNSLAAPFQGDQDLRCADADALVSTFGPLGAKPATFINRKKLQDPNKFVIAGDPATRALWKSYVEAEMALSTPVNMKLETIFVNAEERRFRYRITLKFSEAMQNINLGFLLTESGIVTQQVDGVTHLDEYEHEFVLRDFITSILGEGLTEDILANTVIIKEFEIDLDDFEAQADGKYTKPEDWIIDDMELVAFIRADNDEIIQSTSVEL